MATNFNDIIKQGYVRMKSKKLGVSGDLGEWGDLGSGAALGDPPAPLQVTEISNVKCITRLPKETKRQAVAIVFTDDSARTFTCDSELEAEEWYKTLSVECLGARLNDISLGEPDLLAPGVQCEQT
ncbi:DOK4 protein, partial [Spizella passerina]|nr:DOK4 protein [Spizella passerina]